MKLWGGLIALGLATSAGCRGPSWEAGPSMIAPAQRVADALEDSSPGGELELADLPVVELPTRTRPCCALGMDLGLNLQGVPLPGYQIGNILSVHELTGHAYDNGALTMKISDRPIVIEPNGLVYTCRGGFIDVAHVRDNADLVLYMTLAIVKVLPQGGTIVAPGDGAQRRVTIAPLQAEDVARVGKLELAIAMAQWVVYDFSIWHELATWQGYESTPGFSEQLSAFSPEDLYSNLLGIRIAGGVLREDGYRSRSTYDSLMDGWIVAALERLGAQPASVGRQVMKALDGVLWDSSRRVPDPKLVLRRFFPPGQPVTPWREEDALATRRATATACKGARALPLRVADRSGAILFDDAVLIELEPAAWAGKSFPFPEQGTRVVTHKSLPTVVAATRASIKQMLGEHCDEPR